MNSRLLVLTVVGAAGLLGFGCTQAGNLSSNSRTVVQEKADRPLPQNALDSSTASPHGEAVAVGATNAEGLAGTIAGPGSRWTTMSRARGILIDRLADSGGEKQMSVLRGIDKITKYVGSYSADGRYALKRWTMDGGMAPVDYIQITTSFVDVLIPPMGVVVTIYTLDPSPALTQTVDPRRYLDGRLIPSRQVIRAKLAQCIRNGDVEPTDFVDPRLEMWADLLESEEDSVIEAAVLPGVVAGAPAFSRYLNPNDRGVSPPQFPSEPDPVSERGQK